MLWLKSYYLWDRLGILYGKTPSCKPGTTLGHEGVGVIEEVGNGVRSFKKGDHVIISCITSDGTCEYCKNKCIHIAKMVDGYKGI